MAFGMARGWSLAALLVCGCAGAAVSSAPTAAPAAQPDARPAKPLRLDLVALDAEFAQGASIGLRALVQFAEPKLEGNEVVFQGPPTSQAAFALLVARAFEETESRQTFPVPATCSAVRPAQLAGVEVCAEGEQCTPIDPNPGRVVVCNVDYINQLMLLLRVMHTQELLLQFGTSDAGYMRLVDAVRHRPEELKAQLATADGDHLDGHVMFLTAFLVATELATLTEPRVELPETGGAELSCRAERSWKSHGIWAEGNRLPPFELGAPEDPAAANALDRAWSQRLAADQRAVAALRGLTEFALSTDSPATEVLNDYLMVTLMVPAMLDWYGRLGPFVKQRCPGKAEQPFALTRCMCDDVTSNYRAAMALVDVPEPPLHARVARFTAQLLRDMRGVVAPRLSEQELAVLDLRLRLMSASVESSAKMARGACTASIASSASDAQILLVMGFPAIEGFQGMADEADDFGMTRRFMELACDGAALGE